MSRANQVNNYNITGRLIYYLDFCNNIDECDEGLAERLENFNDVVTGLLGWKDRLARFLEYINIKLWICIVLIAVLSCLSAVFADALAASLFNCTIYIIKLE